MEITISQKRINDRRNSVSSAYINKGDKAVSIIVSQLAKKLAVSEVTIYADLKHLGLTNKSKA